MFASDQLACIDAILGCSIGSLLAPDPPSRPSNSIPRSARSQRYGPLSNRIAQPATFPPPLAHTYFFALFSLQLFLPFFSLPSILTLSTAQLHIQYYVSITPLSHSITPSVSKKDSPVLVFLHSVFGRQEIPGESLKLATWTLKLASPSP
ncbi:hypothetical protein BDD12DRAFT_47524 [Trichophaea hybrida]|nr:hypothetical protein BDD12DRAFT_47524 [Trichophaea hybrida]